MTIAAGTKLGRYEIRSQLGAGGMGEVYLARDLEIGRDVAVKVLPSTFSSDQDRLKRFQQEACAAGALNHPNILSIYDVGKHDGSPYVVSELLEGETLRKRISDTQLAQRRVMDYALQLANGLAAAHEKGIIHRDLKPDNVFITNDGRVKILDFGLAKLTQLDGNRSQTEIPTRRVDTDPGIVMGTLGYMSPEQLKGRTVDQRSDIFSFGAILYEMLSGRRAFHGESAAETMSAILREDPPELSNTNKNVSPGVERLVNRCLEKNPEARFHSASDLAFALEALTAAGANSGQTTTMPALAPRRMARRELLLASIAALAVLAAIVLAVALILSYSRRMPNDLRAVRLFINPPEKTSFGSFAISPDGLRLVFVATDSSGKNLLWVRALESTDARPLSGTDEAVDPFWSPDSRFIGFFAGGKMKRIDATGGPVRTLCIAAVPRGASWNRDGVIIFAPTPNDPLYRIPAEGGEPTLLTKLEPSRQEASHRWPYFLPDGHHFLYSVLGGPQGQGIYVSSMDAKESRRLLDVRDTVVAYAEPGYLLYRREASLLAQAFDFKKLELTGHSFPVAEQVGFEASTFQTYFSVSQTGVLAYSSGNYGLTQLTWVDRSGKELGAIGQPRSYYIRPWVSPDGKRMAVDGPDTQGNRDIWLIDLVTGDPTRFTFDPSTELFPVWSWDGSRIVFASDREGPRHLYVKNASGAGKEELLLKSEANKIPMDWSPDGRFILYVVNDPNTKIDLWLLPLLEDQKPFPFLQTAASERLARFSPDGRWIAYVSDESGSNEIYVRTFPDSGGKWQISTNGGYHLAWAHSGKELFYVSTDKKMMAVDVKGEGTTFQRGTPHALFDRRIPSFNTPLAQFAVSTDDQKFILANPVAENTSVAITVVLNWTADLKR
jgi:serine/threonine protein kinase